MMNVIKPARGVGFSLLGLGLGSVSVKDYKELPRSGETAWCHYLFIHCPTIPALPRFPKPQIHLTPWSKGIKFPKKCCNKKRKKKKKGEETSEIPWSWKISV